jgi:hypothetical protein
VPDERSGPRVVAIGGGRGLAASVEAHVAALRAHGVCPEVVLVDAGGEVGGSGRALDAPGRGATGPENPDPRAPARTVVAHLATPDRTAHDPALLGAALAELARGR